MSFPPPALHALNMLNGVTSTRKQYNKTIYKYTNIYIYAHLSLKCHFFGLPLSLLCCVWQPRDTLRMLKGEAREAKCSVVMVLKMGCRQNAGQWQHYLFTTHKNCHSRLRMTTGEESFESARFETSRYLKWNMTPAYSHLSFFWHHEER